MEDDVFEATEEFSAEEYIGNAPEDDEFASIRQRYEAGETLTDDEMAEIAKLDKGERYYHRTDEQLAQFTAWRPEFEKA